MSENISEIKKLLYVIFNGTGGILDVDFDLFIKQIKDLDGTERDEIITIIGENVLQLLQKLLTKKVLLKLITKLIFKT
jgi:hypothetical protein